MSIRSWLIDLCGTAGIYKMIIKAKDFQSFTIVSNKVARDKELSIKAKGLFLTIASLPQDWVLYKTQLSDFSSDGDRAVISAFNELVEHGYILQVRKFKGGSTKFDGWDYIVYPEKQPIGGFAETENPKTENAQLINKDYTNKELTNKDNLSLSVGSFSLTDNKIVGKEKKVPAAAARAPFLHQQSFQVRQKAFCKEVDKYAERDNMDDTIAGKFKDYYTTPVGELMLFETKEYWDTQRRLSLWEKNERFADY